MSDISNASDKQLAKVLATTGHSPGEHAKEIEAAQLNKHMEMLKYFKETHGLGHGNANLLAHMVRQHLAGGPEAADNLLSAQYAGAKAHLLPLYNELSAICEGMGDDVTKVVQKTGVAFRRNKLFALIQAPSAKRVQLGLNLPETPGGGRVKPNNAMCSHKIDLTSSDELDDQVVAWIRDAYAHR